MAKRIVFEEEARKALLKGIDCCRLARCIPFPSP